MVISNLFCFLILTASAVAQTVEGNVVSSTTGNGIAGVTVEIFPAGNIGYSATTDTQGHFRIEEVRVGSYVPRFSAPDYWLPEFPWLFQVGAGEAPVKLDARMTPLGRITGRVIDGRGEPVPDTTVELTNSRMETNGIRVPFPRTDADGKFDLHQNLFPGAYTLAVVPPLGLKPPDPEPGSEHVLGWARTYYPGVAVPEAAATIVLRPGSELSNIEIKLAAVPAHAVGGVLRNPDGTPAPKVAITLGDALTPLVRVVSMSDGTFQFPAVVDGNWRISGEVEREGVKLRAIQWIDMAGRELKDVMLQFNTPFTLRGKLVIETPPGLSAPPMGSPVLLSVVSPSRRPNSLEQPMAAPTDAHGNFSLHPMYPGRYWINAQARPGYYLDAVRLGEAELAGPEVEVFSEAVQITLVYKTNGGTVRGTVEKCASGAVLLVPQDPAMQLPAFIRQVQCDSNDRYEIRTVRPGEYHALAFSAHAYSPLWTPKFDSGLLNQASRITVRAGEASTADLTAITQPPN